MFIKRLEIKNFQCHEALIFELGPGINALVGESDKGKSAILRAIRWVFLNKPDGLQIKKKGEKEVAVGIQFQDGTVISRARTANVNRYIFHKPGQEEMVFDNFGREIPPPIAEFFGTILGRFGDHVFELPFANQFDSPFLLAESGSIRAQILSSLSKTTIFDEAIKDTNGKVRELGRQINGLDAIIMDYETKVQSYSTLDENIEEIENIIEAINLSKNHEQIAARGTNLILKLNANSSLIDSTGKTISDLESIPDTVQLENIGQLLEKGKKLEGELIKTNSLIDSCVRAIENLDSFSMEELSELEHAAANAARAEDIQQRVNQWKKSFQPLQNEFKSTEAALKNMLESYIRVLSENRVCPTCYGEIDDSNFERIKEALS